MSLHPLVRASLLFWIGHHLYILAAGISKMPWLNAALIFGFAVLLFSSRNQAKRVLPGRAE